LIVKLGHSAPRAARSDDPVVRRLSSRTGFAAVISIVAVYYLFLLSIGTFQLFAPESLDQVFNSVLMHLVRGEFNVDSGAIQFEASIRNGKTYTYFGVFPALLRLLALPFTDIVRAHLARLSCLAAMVIFVALQLRTLLLVHDTLPTRNQKSEFFAVMAVAIVLSGPQIYLLAVAWVYHEPILWAGVMAAAFNLIILRAALGCGGLRTVDLVLLSVLAGLSLHARVPIGVALCVGTVFLIVRTAWSHFAPEDGSRLLARETVFVKQIPAMLSDPSIWLPILVLGMAAVFIGLINFGRWGSPFKFEGDLQDTRLIQTNPDLLTIFRHYGTFSVGRIWVGALYYATGVPWLLKNVPPFAEILHARYVTIDAPPITPLLTNPLMIFFGGIGLYRLWWKPELRAGSLAILRLSLIGHSAAVVLILAVCFLTLRYRFDLMPFVTLAAFIGYRSFSITAAATSQTCQRRVRLAAMGLCVLGIVFSHYVLLLYKASSFGVPVEVRLSLRPFLPSTYLPISGPCSECPSP
jgi:hypothetical protein